MGQWFSFSGLINLIEHSIISDKPAVRAEVSKPNHQAVYTLRYLRANGVMNNGKINNG
jgi:hypothetical protein